MDALNCSQGCLQGTAVETEKSQEEDILYEINRIREKSRNAMHGTKALAQMPPEKRLDLLEEQFKDLKLEDFVRTYTDQSSKCSIRIPGEADFDRIFNTMRKETAEERIINCGACGYKTCKEMATAIYNGTNKRQNCIHYERSKVMEEKQVIEELTDQMKKKNSEIAEFVAKDFSNLDIAINDVSAGNEQTAAESQEIQSTMLEIKDFCDHLNQSFKDIMVLLDSLEGNNRDITSISKKTTLLSLNASIEAARAGDAGKGFSVVASQIKELSSSSDKAAKESIQNKTSITDAIHGLSEQSDKLLLLLEAVNSKTEALAARTQEINAIAETVNRISESVKNKMETLTE